MDTHFHELLIQTIPFPISLNRRNLIGGVPSYKTIENETIERKLKSNLIAVIHFRTDRHAINANGSIYGSSE